MYRVTKLLRDGLKFVLSPDLVLSPDPVLGSRDSLVVRAPDSFVIERLRVRILVEAAGEFSSPESILCADSYSVSAPPTCYRTQVTLPKVQVAGYT